MSEISIADDSSNIPTYIVIILALVILFGIGRYQHNTTENTQETVVETGQGE